MATARNMLWVLFALVLFVSGCASDAVVDAEREAANAAAKAKITAGMAEGLQNNIELRKMLIGKWMKEYPSDLNQAMNQYRHIVRIQTETFGADSDEAAEARG